MKLSIVKNKALHFALALSAIMVTTSASAVAVMDARVDNLVAQLNGVKNSLNLNPNQQTLWQQTEIRTRTILHARELRREHLQAEIGQRMDLPAVELRDMNKLIEAEEEASVQENKQLRELWLTLNDALDDNQRQVAQGFLLEQLNRQDAGAHDDNHDKPAGNTPKRGSGRHGGGSQQSNGVSTQF